MNEIYFLFQDYLPPSPEAVDSSENIDAKFEFTKVECLLFAFHTVGKQDNKYLVENPDDFKELKVSAVWRNWECQSGENKYFSLFGPSFVQRLEEEWNAASLHSKLWCNKLIFLYNIFHAL